MQERQPSRTARGAALHRALHQRLEGGEIFSDPLAAAILGEEAVSGAETEAKDPSIRSTRLFFAARSRFAEDALANAIARGVRQAVVLGAGLDTFGLRNPHAQQGLRVFEVDHPATQAWKQRRLGQAALIVPPSLTFVPIDFECGSLVDALVAAGFQTQSPAFFLWLGVVPYLTHETIDAVLGFIAALPDSEVVFDYSEPLENYPPARRKGIVAMAEHVTAMGEPWLTHFDPAVLARDLRALGFTEQEDLGPQEMAVRFYGVPKDEAPTGAGPRVIRTRQQPEAATRTP